MSASVTPAEGTTPAQRFPAAEFRAAMEARDPERALRLFTDDCVLRPVGTDYFRFKGKQTAQTLLTAVLSVPDEWEYTEEFANDDFLAVMVRIRFSGIDMHAVDFLRINEEGRAYEMFLLARPQWAVAIFTGRVALKLAARAGRLRYLIMRLLVGPLELSQHIAARFGAWLIKPAVPPPPRR